MNSNAATRPTVSVIIPTYNRKESIRRTLASLSQQTLPVDRFEVIVVDDGSTDGTGTLAHDSFPFTLCYVPQPNQGEIVARNTGAERSCGDLLVFLDDDIEVHSRYLEALASVHVSHRRAVVLGNLVDVPKAGHVTNTPDTLEDMCVYGSFAHFSR